MKKTYCGYVSIIGKPNVGKSTILNSILEKKVSITSRKSQTTRNNIIGIKNIAEYQMIFTDTPGMHLGMSKPMNKILNKSAASIIEDADIILFVLQRLKFNDEDNKVLEKIIESNKKTICLINKVDQIRDKNKLLPYIKELSNKHRFAEIIPISAISNGEIIKVVEAIKKYLPMGKHIYDESLEFNKNKKDIFLASEIIREKIIRLMVDELPHDTYVSIEKFEKNDNVYHIYANIFVARDSQKQIVIGKQGANIKKIGERARLDLENYFSSKVYLKTWVKIKKTWNNDFDFIDGLGVGSSYES